MSCPGILTHKKEYSITNRVMTTDYSIKKFSTRESPNLIPPKIWVSQAAEWGDPDIDFATKISTKIEYSHLF